MQADLTPAQQANREMLLIFGLVTRDENMPGRCFIGERNLDTFTQQDYCYGSFYMVVELFIDATFVIESDDLERCNIGATSLTGAVVSCVVLVLASIKIL